MAVKPGIFTRLWAFLFGKGDLRRRPEPATAPTGPLHRGATIGIAIETAATETAAIASEAIAIGVIATIEGPAVIIGTTEIGTAIATHVGEIETAIGIEATASEVTASEVTASEATETASETGIAAERPPADANTARPRVPEQGPVQDQGQGRPNQGQGQGPGQGQGQPQAQGQGQPLAGHGQQGQGQQGRGRRSRDAAAVNATSMASSGHRRTAGNRRRKASRHRHTRLIHHRRSRVQGSNRGPRVRRCPFIHEPHLRQEGTLPS